MCPLHPGRQTRTKWRLWCLKISTRTHQWCQSWIMLPHDATPTPVFDFWTVCFVAACSSWQSEKVWCRLTSRVFTFIWETVLFSVMGYYNHWAWKAMYDSSFPTPFPLPQPKLSHSLGSRNTECKHFFPTRGNTMVSGHSRSFTVVRCLLFLLY